MAGAGAPSQPRHRERRIKDLALFPLQAVLFPGGRLPLRIFEQRYMGMAKACLRAGSPFGVCLIREGAEVLSEGVEAPAVPENVGCLARIGAWDMPQLGLLHVVAHGEQRFRILERRVQRGGLQTADVELIAPDADDAVPQSCRRCVELLSRIAARHPEAVEAPPHMESCAWVGARLAELLPLPNDLKQALLELTDARARLERIERLLG